MKNLKKYILIWLLTISSFWLVVFATTEISDFSNPVSQWSIISAAWYNHVNNKLKWGFEAWWICAANSAWTISCINSPWWTTWWTPCTIVSEGTNFSGPNNVAYINNAPFPASTLHFDPTIPWSWLQWSDSNIDFGLRYLDHTVWQKKTTVVTCTNSSDFNWAEWCPYYNNGATTQLKANKVEKCN